MKDFMNAIKMMNAFEKFKNSDDAKVSFDALKTIVNNEDFMDFIKDKSEDIHELLNEIKNEMTDEKLDEMIKMQNKAEDLEKRIKADVKRAIKKALNSVRHKYSKNFSFDLGSGDEPVLALQIKIDKDAL